MARIHYWLVPFAVVKSAIPVLTVLACILRGDRISVLVLASLVPTVAGVALASLSDSEYSVIGLAAACGSAVAQTALNITSKQKLSSLSLSGAQGRCVLATICAITPPTVRNVAAALGWELCLRPRLR